MSRPRRHTIIVEIECLDPQGSHQAESRLLRWLETFGHTSVGHGFEFFKVGRVAGKPMKGRIKKPKKAKPQHDGNLLESMVNS